jgi:ABC-type transport system involved in multi-copper enzyme maturation permease subunit
MISRPLVKYVLTAAARDKLMMTLVLMIVSGGALSTFMGSAAVTEQDSFAMVFGSGGLRFLGVIGIVLFCCFYIRRVFENKEVEFLLSRPISRITFLFSHAAAFIILAVVVAAVVIMAVSILGRPDLGGLLVWGVSITVEFAMMAVASLFFSMVLSSAAGSALATLGLYALARMVGTLLGVLDHTPDNWFFAVLGNVMEIISIVIPRLDLMGQTTWLVYGVGDTAGLQFLTNASQYAHVVITHLGILGFIGLQGIFFTAVLLAASTYDFMRRQF